MSRAELLKQKFETVKVHPWTPVVFFLGGFVFDVLVLKRPDELWQILHQASYLLILTGLLYLEILQTYEIFMVPEKWKKLWKFHGHLTQFLMGTLLNIYTFFYFKSSSLLASLIFVLFISALLYMNEFVKLKRHQIVLRLVLYFLCLASFWMYVIPTIVGFVGVLPFVLALIITAGYIAFFYRIVERKTRVTPDVRRKVQRKVGGAGAGVILTFIIFYWFQLIPPVPLSVSYFGIFREIKKENGEYILSYSRPKWIFWENGDQTFYARSGDQIIAFARVFAPKGFHDELRIRWMLKTSRGWEKQDSIPIQISGGRDDGFRGYTVKSNYQPGEYRVEVVTTDEREVGRLYVKIIADPSTELRELRELRQ